MLHSLECSTARRCARSQFALSASTAFNIRERISKCISHNDGLAFESRLTRWDIMCWLCTENVVNFLIVFVHLDFTLRSDGWWIEVHSVYVLCASILLSRSPASAFAGNKFDGSGASIETVSAEDTVRRTAGRGAALAPRTKPMPTIFRRFHRCTSVDRAWENYFSISSIKCSLSPPPSAFVAYFAQSMIETWAQVQSECARQRRSVHAKRSRALFRRAATALRMHSCTGAAEESSEKKIPIN